MHAGLQTDTDEALACQAQAGSLSCFEELVHRYEARIYRFVANGCRDDSDAQELTQETFVSAYLNLHKFDVRRSFATWLFTIARRKGIDHHRANRPVNQTRTAELIEEENPSTLLARREAGEDLWHLARGTLPEAQFQALWLKYAEDMSVRDIARVLRRTPTHVKVLLFRGRTRLGRELDQQRVLEESATRPAKVAGAKWPSDPRARSAATRLAAVTPGPGR